MVTEKEITIKDISEFFFFIIGRSNIAANLPYAMPGTARSTKTGPPERAFSNLGFATVTRKIIYTYCLVRRWISRIINPSKVIYPRALGRGKITLVG